MLPVRCCWCKKIIMAISNDVQCMLMEMLNFDRAMPRKIHLKNIVLPIGWMDGCSRNVKTLRRWRWPFLHLCLLKIYMMWTYVCIGSIYSMNIHMQTRTAIEHRASGHTCKFKQQINTIFETKKQRKKTQKMNNNGNNEMTKMNREKEKKKKKYTTKQKHFDSIYISKNIKKENKYIKRGCARASVRGSINF